MERAYRDVKGNRLTAKHSDANVPPGTAGQRVNSDLVWLRLNGGAWACTGHRSMAKVEKMLRMFADLQEAFAEMTGGDDR